MSGNIASPQVALLAKTHGNRRVRDDLDGFLPTLLANVEELPFDDFAETVAHFVDLADEDGAHDQRDDAIEHRRARVVNSAGAIDMNMYGGDGATTDELIGIFNRFCATEFQTDLAARRDLHGDDALDHDLARTASQRAHDAMTAIFRAAAASGSTGQVAAMVVNVVIDSNTFARTLTATGLAPTNVDGRPVDPFTGLPISNTLLDDLTADPAGFDSIRCETDRGVPVHPHDVLRAALAGHVRRVIVDGDGRIIDYGRRKRLFVGAAREAAKLLIRHCEHPGCDLPAEFCDVDHNNEWNDHGVTDQTNSQILCSGHNQAKHRHRYRRRKAANNRRYTIRNDGTIILPVGARTPTFGETDDPFPWQHDTDPDHIQQLQHLARQRAAALSAE